MVPSSTVSLAFIKIRKTENIRNTLLEIERVLILAAIIEGNLTKASSDNLI